MSFETEMLLKETMDICDFGFIWQSDSQGILMGDTIASSIWSITNINTTVMDLSQVRSSFGSYWTKVWLSGGSHGSIYMLTNVITTASGRTFERSCKMQCRIM
jgi:hypothetical protein